MAKTIASKSEGNSKVAWTRKDLLGLKDLSREEIQLILDTAKSLSEISDRTVKKVPALRGKTIVNLFLETFTIPILHMSSTIVNTDNSKSIRVVLTLFHYTLIANDSGLKFS